MGSHVAMRVSTPPSGRPRLLAAARLCLLSLLTSLLHCPFLSPLALAPPTSQRVRDELKLIREATAAADARLTAEGIDPSTWPPPGICSVHPKGGSGAAAGVGVRVMGGAAMRAEDVRIPLLG